jgi:hypothetical protein
MGVGLVRRQLGTLVGLLVPGGPFVGRAPPEFDRHRGLPLTEGSDALSGLEGMHLAKAGLARGHPKIAACASLKIVTRPWNGYALGVIGCLVEAHVPCLPTALPCARWPRSRPRQSPSASRP